MAPAQALDVFNTLLPHRYGVHRPPTCLPVLAIIASLITGCDDSDVIPLRITVGEDGSGTLTVKSMLLPETPGPVERAASGIAWTQRVTFATATGTFPNLSSLRVEDMTFEQGSTGEGEGYVQATLPLGEQARWPDTFAATRTGDFEAVAKLVDPTGPMNLGRQIKIVLTLPGRIIAQGTRPETRNVKMEVHDNVRPGEQDDGRNAKRVATLVMPLALARSAAGNMTCT